MARDLTTTDPGPFSSLFNYDEEAKRLEERKTQLQEAQKKIQRTNLLGEGLKLLTDFVGGSKGATINERPINPGIIKSTERYNALEDQYTADLDGLRTTQLKSRYADLKHMQDLQAEQREANRQIARKQSDEEASIRQENRRMTNEQKLITQRGEEQRKNDTHTTTENIRQAKGIYDLQRANLNKSVPRSQMRTTADVPFIVPGTTETIYLRPEEINEMQHELTKDKSKYDPDLAQALKDLLDDKVTRDDSMIQVLKRNWDKIKYVLPEYAGQKPPELTQEEIRKNEYDDKLQSLHNDTKLSSRQRVKKINELNEEYSDIIIPKTIIYPDANGVQDLSSIFRKN